MNKFLLGRALTSALVASAKLRASGVQFLLFLMASCESNKRTDSSFGVEEWKAKSLLWFSSETTYFIVRAIA